MTPLSWPPDWSDPVVVALAIAAGFGLLLLILVALALAAGRRSARAVEPMAAHIAALGQSLQVLGQNQQQLQGGLSQVTEAQANAQMRLMEVVNQRLETVSARMGDSLTQSATRTDRKSVV